MKAKYWNARKLFYEKGSLIKVNITVRCHNPRRALTHRELFPRNGHSIFCLHVILLQPLTCCLSCVTRHVKNMTKWRAKATFAMTIKKVWLRVTKVHGIINLRKRWTKLKRSRSLIQVKTSQILTIQDRLLKKIMLPSLGSAFFVLFFFFLVFPICMVRWTSKRRMWLWNSHEDHIARCEQSGCHHFIGWRHILWIYFSGEGVTCLQMPKTHNRFSQEYHVFKWINRVCWIDAF